jgi:hypothetical protein
MWDLREKDLERTTTVAPDAAVGRAATNALTILASMLASYVVMPPSLRFTAVDRGGAGGGDGGGGAGGGGGDGDDDVDAGGGGDGGGNGGGGGVIDATVTHEPPPPL